MIQVKSAHAIVGSLPDLNHCLAALLSQDYRLIKVNHHLIHHLPTIHHSKSWQRSFTLWKKMCHAINQLSSADSLEKIAIIIYAPLPSKETQTIYFAHAKKHLHPHNTITWLDPDQYSPNQIIDMCASYDTKDTILATLQHDCEYYTCLHLSNTPQDDTKTPSIKLTALADQPLQDLLTTAETIHTIWTMADLNDQAIAQQHYQAHLCCWRDHFKIKPEHYPIALSCFNIGAQSTHAFILLIAIAWQQQQYAQVNHQHLIWLPSQKNDHYLSIHYETETTHASSEAHQK